MVIYCKSVHFRGFAGPGTPGQAFYEMASFSENRALRLLQESGERLCTLRELSPGLLLDTLGQGLGLTRRCPPLTPQETALSATT